MEELTLQEIKRIEFDLLLRFDAFCKEHHIRYFLSNGTLLGAVKYKGFIPWDDDVDVLVPREDYQKLLTLFRDDERYRLFAFERTPEFRFPFAKLCDMTTRKQESNQDNGAVLGLDMDIFPLDAWSGDLRRARREVASIGRSMLCLYLTKSAKADSQNPVKRLVKRLVMVAAKLAGGPYFVRRIIRKSTSPVFKRGVYVGCKSWCIYGEREIIPAEAFEDTTEVSFEGETFPAPVGYDTYLRSLYGDYVQDPPVEKQKTHHSFVAYRVDRA